MATMATTPRPVYGEPEFVPRVEYPAFLGTPGSVEPELVGWDLSFGSRINFGPDTTGDLHVSLQLSDDALANGQVVRAVTREQVFAFAQHLLSLVGARPVLALPEGV